MGIWIKKAYWRVIEGVFKCLCQKGANTKGKKVCSEDLTIIPWIKGE